jgi:hypothetical protein
MNAVSWVGECGQDSGKQARRRKLPEHAADFQRRKSSSGKNGKFIN